MQESIRRKPRYKRVLLKLSGEALMGDLKYGIDPERLRATAAEISQVVSYPEGAAPGRASHATAHPAATPRHARSARKPKPATRHPRRK